VDLPGAYRQYLDTLSSLLATDRLRQRLWLTVFADLINNISDDHILLHNYTTFIDRYIHGQDVFSPWFIRIPYTRLTDYGNIQDPESPLGHFIQLMSFPQANEDALTLYAPCAFSIPERVINYGPEISALYAYNVHRPYFASRHMTLRDVYAIHWKTWEHFRPSWLHRSHQRARRDLYLLSAFIKSRRLLWTPLRSSQHFYEEAIKFYAHDQSKQLYVGSSSPGILIPEEFYGEDIYYPGISKDVPPNVSIFDTERGHSNSFINLRWLLQQRIHNNVSVTNPFRIPFCHGYRLQYTPEDNHL
jgi:hypothetical protein